MNEQKFLALYQRQQESGLTIIEFCANEGLAPATFHYWKKKLGSQNRLPGFIPIVVNTSVSSTKGNYPCQSDLLPHETQNQKCPSVEVVFPNKTIVRIKNEPDLNLLKALIHLID